MASVVPFLLTFKKQKKMINQNELRIGNIIHFPFISDNVKVVGLALVENDKQIRVQTAISGSHNFFELPEKYAPIELNDKVLLDIKGFEKVYNSKYTRIIEFYNSDKMQLLKWTYKKEEKNFNLEINGRSYPHIEFLHQLQNLFFFLFNEELVFSTEP